MSLATATQECSNIFTMVLSWEPPTYLPRADHTEQLLRSQVGILHSSENKQMKTTRDCTNQPRKQGGKRETDTEEYGLGGVIYIVF